MYFKLTAVIILLCIGNSFFEASVSAAGPRNKSEKSDHQHPKDNDSDRRGPKKTTEDSHEHQRNSEQNGLKKVDKDHDKSRNEKLGRNEPKRTDEIKENSKNDSSTTSSKLDMGGIFRLRDISNFDKQSKTGEQPPNCEPEQPETCSCAAEEFRLLGEEYINCTIKIIEVLKTFNESCQGDPNSNLTKTLEEFKINITIGFEVVYLLVKDDKCEEAYVQFQSLSQTIIAYQGVVLKQYEELDSTVKEAVQNVVATCDIAGRQDDCSEKLKECSVQSKRKTSEKVK